MKRRGYAVEIDGRVVAGGRSYAAARLAALETARAEHRPVAIRSAGGVETVPPEEATDEAIAAAHAAAAQGENPFAHRVGTLAAVGRTN